MSRSICSKVCDYYFDSFFHSCQEAKNASAGKWLRATIMALFSLTIVVPVGFCLLRCCITPILSQHIQEAAVEITEIAAVTLSPGLIAFPPSVPTKELEPVALTLPKPPIQNRVISKEEIDQAIRVFEHLEGEGETEAMQRVKVLFSSNDLEQIKRCCEEELNTVCHTDSYSYVPSSVFVLKYAHLAISQEIFDYLCSKIDGEGSRGIGDIDKLLFRIMHRKSNRSGYLRSLLAQLKVVLFPAKIDDYLLRIDLNGLSLMHYAVLFEDEEVRNLLIKACPELAKRRSLDWADRTSIPGAFVDGLSSGSATPEEFARAFWPTFYWNLASEHICDRLPENREGTPIELFPGWNVNRGRNFSEVIAKIDVIDASPGNPTGLTLLHYAALFQNKDAIEQLKKQGASWERAKLLDVEWRFGDYVVKFSKEFGEEISPKEFADSCVDRLIAEYMVVRLSKGSCRLWGEVAPRQKTTCMAIVRMLEKRLVEEGGFLMHPGIETDEEMIQKLQAHLDRMELSELLGCMHQAHLEARHLFAVACQEKRYDLAYQLLDLGVDPLERSNIQLGLDGDEGGRSEKEKAIQSPLKSAGVSELEIVKELEKCVRQKASDVERYTDLPRVLVNLINEYG